MENELYHYGVLGMKWGIRRYQNDDGTLTSWGKRHYRGYEGKLRKSIDAAHISRKISKLEKKGKLSDKKQEKLSRLKTMRSGLTKDLSDKDIKRGERLFKVQRFSRILNGVLGGSAGMKDYQTKVGKEADYRKAKNIIKQKIRSDSVTKEKSK